MTHSHLLPGLQSFTHLKIADFIFYHRLSYVSIYQHAIQGLIAQSQPQFRWRHSAVILIHPDMDPSPKITSPHSSCLNPNFSWSKQSKPPIFPWKKMKKKPSVTWSTAMARASSPGWSFYAPWWLFPSCQVGRSNLGRGCGMRVPLKGPRCVQTAENMSPYHVFKSGARYGILMETSWNYNRLLVAIEWWLHEVGLDVCAPWLGVLERVPTYSRDWDFTSKLTQIDARICIYVCVCVL